MAVWWWLEWQCLLVSFVPVPNIVFLTDMFLKVDARRRLLGRAAVSDGADKLLGKRHENVVRYHSI